MGEWVSAASVHSIKRNSPHAVHDRKNKTYAWFKTTTKVFSRMVFMVLLAVSWYQLTEWKTPLKQNIFVSFRTAQKSNSANFTHRKNTNLKIVQNIYSWQTFLVH